jgi:hypothetical protein
MKLAAMGVTIVVSTGDNGAAGDDNLCNVRSDSKTYSPYWKVSYLSHSVESLLAYYATHLLQFLLSCDCGVYLLTAWHQACGLSSPNSCFSDCQRASPGRDLGISLPSLPPRRTSPPWAPPWGRRMATRRSPASPSWAA